MLGAVWGMSTERRGREVVGVDDNDGVLGLGRKKREGETERRTGSDVEERCEWAEEERFAQPDLGSRSTSPGAWGAKSGVG